MLKHHLTKYKVCGKTVAASWLQLNIFGKCFCFSQKTINIDE